MISKGDLVKMRLSLGGASEGVTEIFILGRMMNYCDEEEAYIVEPKALSVGKDQVVDIERLIHDFDFQNVSEELSVIEKERERETPPDITNIRVSHSH